MSSGQEKRRAPIWIARIFTLLLLIAGVSSHFFPIADPFILAQRTERKSPLKIESRSESEIEAEIAETWSKLQSKLTPSKPSQSYPAATDKQIAELENMIGSPLPADFKAFLKIHNGGDGFYTVNEMIHRYSQNMSTVEFAQTADTQLTKNKWHPGLVVFYRRVYAIHLGNGCVVEVRPAAKPFTRISVPTGNSFTEFLSHYSEIENLYRRVSEPE